MLTTTQDRVNQSYILLKHEDGFLSLKNPNHYIRVTSHYIEDYIANTKVKFSTSALIDLLSDSWQIQILNYELGILFEWGEVAESNEVELATLINFSTIDKITPHCETILTNAKALEVISKESYTELYNKTFENLLAGNCYQLNLTSQLKFKIEDVDILEKSFSSAQIFDHLCEFAHLVNLPLQDRLIISNSPECLYEYSREDKKLVTRPIKGTVRVEQGADAFKNDIKNESELNIITDLLRNDLSRIGENFSIVEAQKEIFEVPGLIHQYSKISVECHDFNSVKVLKSIYPGGSITGAPKKRVLKLINSIEKGTRGIYTGSTVVNLHNINKASINIRTLVVSKSSNHAVYGAGGGITLLSSAHGEYFELLDKANSFLKVFFKDVKL